MEPTSNCHSASGTCEFAGAAAVMQAVESQTLILYHTDLRGEWPHSAARALAARLPYVRRLAANRGGEAARASLAGVGLALRALTQLLGRGVSPGELVFAPGRKPGLAQAAAPDFSIAHSGPWVGCAAVGRGRVGFDVELGSGERITSWVAREAALKACGAGLRALPQVRLDAGGAHCGGERWHAHALRLFPGAAACVMTSLVVHEVDAHALSLAELFVP